MRAAQSRQVVPHAEIAERNDRIGSRVVARNSRSNRRQALPHHAKRQRKFGHVSSDVKQAVSDLEVRHILDEYRRTHTASPRMLTDVPAGPASGVRAMVGRVLISLKPADTSSDRMVA